ncbi:Positive regulator of purine utilization [Lachnellula suecica]|uniref:Positive regulator of purine utilization n=1 Tax=Lachnellula suecica TaxID=602035 RepID=A0A8T9CGE0_9HELO|nr:Positive regulator of purine utilization [Lachnellula suecica]
MKDNVQGLENTGSRRIEEQRENSRSETQTVSSQDEEPAEESLRHEIGLVSLSGGTDPRYIGPSSGYSFARLLLACASRQGHRIQASRCGAKVSDQYAFLLPNTTAPERPTPLPADMEYTMKLSETYFETIHIQHPFLHRPTHMRLIKKVYEDPEASPIDHFQVNMVLAISATALSRKLKISLPGLEYCANAMQYFGKLYLENSLRSLQCLLLLVMHTLYSASIGYNVWYLNYQCIAALLDLGLQRDVKAGKGISVLEQELRTRTFWVVYGIDRYVATMMGRPIGLRDEACDLRLPADVDDRNLSANAIQPRQDGEPPNHMSYAIHMFKMARKNSEIKYICHSISHNTPSYSYPAVPDISAWQRGVLERLAIWKQEIPLVPGSQSYGAALCEARYYGIMQLLLSASPAIPNPSTEDLKACHKNAMSSIQLCNKQYKSDQLIYCWAVVHSIFLSTITLLHCIWTVPDIASQTHINELMAILNAGSNILSASGEYWSEAKRSRDVLDGLSAHTVRWLLDRNHSVESQAHDKIPKISQSLVSHNVVSHFEAPGAYSDMFSSSDVPALDFDGQFWGSSLYGSLLGDLNFTDNMNFDDPGTVNAIMQGMFTNDFHLSLDFGQEYGIPGE